MILNKKECIDILKKSGCSEEVIEHCKVVAKLSVKIAELSNADIKLVEASALLHDIGRAITHGISHGVEGSKLARELNLPECIALIIERHIGAGINKTESEKLRLPVKDYIPITLEEKIVAHADNLISHNKKQKLSSCIAHYIDKGREDIAERIIRLHKELSEKCGIELDEISID